MPRAFKTSSQHNVKENEGSARIEGNTAPSPKHIPFPEIPNNTEVVNELIIFVFSVFSAGMQFLNIYKTAWWIPNSHVNHAINLYLIDPFLVAFIAVMLSRRLIYVLINNLIMSVTKAKNLKIYRMIAKYTFIALLSTILGSCIMKIFAKHNYLCFFLLLYPLVVYFLIFGPQIESFLRMLPPDTEATYMNNFPMHCCLTNAVAVRDEIEILKNDFNNRFKQIIFTSLANAYYAGFVPCFFAQNFIYYDVIFTTIYITFVWLNGFMMCTMFCFPAKYCDILHRASLHLGSWQRIDGRSNITAHQQAPPSTWSKNSSWPSGSIVRYSGDLWRSVGLVTTAIPGNTSHYRFKKLFANPSFLYMILTVIHTTFVILQIIVLCFSIKWHNILSLSFLALTNHHTLFQIVRDYLITQKVYAAETSIYEKLNTHFN